MTTPTIETDLGKILDQINQNLDNLNKQVTNIKVELAEIKGDIKALKEDVKELKSSQKAQIWTLIGILGTAVVGTVIRFVITAMPGGSL